MATCGDETCRISRESLLDIILLNLYPWSTKQSTFPDIHQQSRTWSLEFKKNKILLGWKIMLKCLWYYCPNYFNNQNSNLWIPCLKLWNVLQKCIWKKKNFCTMSVSTIFLITIRNTYSYCAADQLCRFGGYPAIINPKHINVRDIKEAKRSVFDMVTGHMTKHQVMPLECQELRFLVS